LKAGAILLRMRTISERDVGSVQPMQTGAFVRQSLSTQAQD